MGSSYQGDEKTRRALDTYIKLMRASDSMTNRVTRHLPNAELTISQFDVLESIYFLGPLCQRDIAKKIRKSTGNITMVIDNLEKRGLVRRERDAEDRRYFTIHLTGAGQALIGEVFPNHAAAITEQMAVLTEAEQDELGRLCRKLGLQQKEV